MASVEGAAAQVRRLLGLFGEPSAHGQQCPLRYKSRTYQVVNGLCVIGVDACANRPARVILQPPKRPVDQGPVKHIVVLGTHPELQVVFALPIARLQRQRRFEARRFLDRAPVRGAAPGDVPERPNWVASA